MQEEGKQEVVGRRKTGIGKKVNRKQENTIKTKENRK